MRLALVFLLCCGACGSVLAQGSEAYQASVSVSDQGAGARDPALREALTQVIVRVSGDGALAQAQNIIARAPQLVQRYGYEVDEGKQLKLVAAFDPRAVEAALKAQGLPVWGVVAGPVEDVTVEVSAVGSAADYAAVLAALRAVPGVKGVQVLAAQGDRLSLRLRAEGGASRIAGAASLGSALMRDESAGGLAFRVAH